MSGSTTDPRGFWGSRLTFTLAAVGCALGLGNLWRWPVLAETHGGVLFVGTYLVFLLALGLPLLMAEFMLGRQYRQQPTGALREAVRQSALPRRWVWVSRTALLAGYLVLTFFAALGGLALAYVYRGAFGDFDGINADQAAMMLQETVSGESVLLWQLLFVVSLLLVSMRGIHQGLSRSVRVVVPVILLLLLLMLVFASRTAELAVGWQTLFVFEPAAFGVIGILEALTQAFYTVGVATGAMLMLGAYMPGSGSVRASAWYVVLLDLVFAVLAGVFVYGLLQPAGLSATPGFGVLFQSLPMAMSEAAADQGLGGRPIIGLFFVMVTLLAWSSAIIVFEPLVAWFQSKLTVTRQFATIFMGVLVWLGALVSLFALGRWDGISLLGHSPFAWLSFVATGVLMPIAALALAFFLGWVRPAWLNRQGLVLGKGSFLGWQIFMRWVVPSLLVTVALFAFGQFLLDALWSR